MRFPNRIAWKHVLIVAGDPTLELRSSLLGYDLDTVMHESKAHATFGPLVDHLQSALAFLYNFMSLAAVHIKNYRWVGAVFVRVADEAVDLAFAGRHVDEGLFHANDALI